ncbi:MAG: NAD(P)/FAD-dependent oxidoreductase [Oscillospiraceae bacterium]|nr:NAD(P)/FAD-dependent oxidoreductase [Oscillospiraceae bacterium]
MPLSNYEYDAIIIGGGPAGLMCAGTAARRGLRVLLCEQGGRTARKLRITGKGRCNVTNNCSPEELLRKIRSNPRFMYSAAYAWTCQDTMDFFEELGVPLKTERGGRVFPHSDLAGDIARALEGWALQDVDLAEEKCSKLLVEDGAVKGVACKSGREYFAPSVVLATGGKSYPRTGSDGSGYKLARNVGHTLVEPRASLIPMETAEDWCRELTGLSLRNVTLSLWQQGKKKPAYSEIGEMLFTHFGISGPLVLTASSYMKTCEGYFITIDLKPGLTMEQLDARLLRDFEQYTNKDFRNALGDLLPKSMIPVMVALSGIGGETKVHQITRQQRSDLCALIKALPVTPVAFRPVEEAIVTAGGISVKEIDPRTMQSKVMPGLFFAGEVMDLDATTGGYNLQIAFSTGRLAGENL